MSKPVVEKAEGASLLGWLGFRNSRGGDETIAPSGPSAAAGGRSVLDHAKQQLLDEIAAFVLAHELEVTPANLALACEAFSGANPGLARQIVTRTQSGDAITQEWLDEATATARGRGLAGRVAFRCQDAKRFVPASSGYSFSSCIGSTHALGGLASTLATLRQWTRPGGWIVVGEGFWMREPDPEYLAMLGADRDEFGGPAWIEEKARTAGLDPMEQWVSTAAE